MKLIIVESPTKAKTISKFLDSSYQVESSFGHIRDLPKGNIGVDVENDFSPKYIVPKDKVKLVNQLKKIASKAEKVILASDEDREGESIAWHLSEVFKIPPERLERIVFHEITKDAILYALSHPRKIDFHLVQAQQARRVLDRLVGYELSPFLWRKIARGLSAGRVQSVAVRLIVEREREIQAFVKEDYWTLDAIFHKKEDENIFLGRLHAIDDKILEKFAFRHKDEIQKILLSLKEASYAVKKIFRKAINRKSDPPFTTSTLQQEANRKLGFSAKQTMRIAQQLYEGVDIGKEGSVGLITYMRTDSVNLSETFLLEASEYLKNNFGPLYTLLVSRKFKTKSKGAQEAHEAIRPTMISHDPEIIKNFLTPHQYKLYRLIWCRALASQMPEARLEQTLVDIHTQIEDKVFMFRSSGTVIVFDGFLKLYPLKKTSEVLPALKEGDILFAKQLESTEHCTEPPARYTDASLVKTLEEHGIGRPSTYAPIISTIIDRGYVVRDEKKLKPAEIAFLVIDLLRKHFPNIVDYSFTASLEEDLDKIALEEKPWKPVIAEFYHPFHQNLLEKDKELQKKDLTEETSDEICEKCGSSMIIKMARFGKFLACSAYPECKNTHSLNEKGEKAIVETREEKCVLCGKSMILRHGRYGTFLGCSGYPECKHIQRIEKSIGVQCQKCSVGNIVERRSRFGKIFYGCNRYPECKNIYKTRPESNETLENKL